MLNGYSTADARDALQHIPSNLPRDDWHRMGRAAIAAGLPVDDVVEWSSTAANFKSEQDVRAAFRTVKPEGGTGPGTLFQAAAANGWRKDGDKPQHKPQIAPSKVAEPPRRPAPGMSPAEVLSRCEPATARHSVIVAKQAAGVPLAGLHVLPADDHLTIVRGESMAGSLVVPVLCPDGTVSTVQFITPPDVAARLKAKGKPGKMNLPGCPLEGWHTVGDLLPSSTVYVCEGIGQAWACWKATGHPAVVCFGWGRVRGVAGGLRQQDASARLVLVPDAGKEADAEAIARDIGAAVACMPPGEANNFDANDYAIREGFSTLGELLEAARAPAKLAPRYKLLGANDLRELAALAWRVRGVLPAVGLAGLYGPSASGKSFLALDLAAAIAEGTRWFDCRVESAPVVYAALEGEGGFKLRVAAWEAYAGRTLPDGLSMVLQPFKLIEPQDVNDLAAVVPAGAVVFLDTLNRAAPTADENSSKDMGEILTAAKHLQSLINGLVVLVHHTGKDATRGLRGHSSLFAALDAAVEVSRDGERREWKVAKSKDGQDGNVHPFKLRVETLGLDEHGDPLTSCVVMADTVAQDVQRAKVPQGDNQRLVYEGIRSLFKDGATGKTGAPPLRPCIELEAAVMAGAARLSCPTDKRTSRARTAISGLVTRGVLGLNEGWLWTV